LRGKMRVTLSSLDRHAGLPIRTIPGAQFRPAPWMRELFGGFALMLGAGVLLVYVVLVLLFGGFLQPLTIMSALPFSLGGALMALVMTQRPLGIAAVVGRADAE
jgi:HAE1 family hydrophobic/amphiphilic exporter-1